MSMSDSQQKREAVVEDFRTIRLSSGRNLTEDTPTAVSPWNYPSTRSCGFSQQDQLKNYDDSDAESHGSEEDVLENAGVWNIEEAHKILRDKMKKLQKLYTLQMKHLHMEYKMQRRKYLLEKQQYLNSVKQNPQPGTSQNTYYQDYKVNSTKQISRELLIKAKTRQCLRQYCKKRGIDAVLYKRQQARKHQQTVNMYNNKQEARCIVGDHSANMHPQIQQMGGVEGGESYGEVAELKLSLQKIAAEMGMEVGRCRACEEAALPLSGYCRHHLLQDSKQLLYTHCCHSGCKRVVLRSHSTRCSYHPLILDLPPAGETATCKSEPDTQDKGTSTAAVPPKENGSSQPIKQEEQPTTS